MNKDGFVKLDDKTLKESIDELQGTQFLDAFCVLTHIKACKEENSNLKQSLIKIRKILSENKNLGQAEELDYYVIRQNILQIIREVVGDEK